MLYKFFFLQERGALFEYSTNTATILLCTLWASFILSNCKWERIYGPNKITLSLIRRNYEFWSYAPYYILILSCIYCMITYNKILYLFRMMYQKFVYHFIFSKRRIGNELEKIIHTRVCLKASFVICVIPYSKRSRCYLTFHIELPPKRS